MHRILLVAAATFLAQTVLVAQEAVSVAPEKETELKGRVSKFWEGFVTGKYRTSDAFVSDEAKEDFFSWPKKKIKGYTIDRIQYVKDGKSAKVLTLVDTTLSIMGVGAMEIKQPVETWWREESEGWFWFLPKNEVRDTPFGKMESNASSGEAPLIPLTAMQKAPDMKTLMNSVKPDKSEVSFVAGESGVATVSFSNGLPGVVSLTLDFISFEDLTYALKSKDVAKGESGELIITYKPKNKDKKLTAPVTKTVTVGVLQTGRQFPINVVIAPRP
jgi:hypothetical protein